MRTFTKTVTSLAMVVASLGMVSATATSASAAVSYADKTESATVKYTNGVRDKRDLRAVKGNACIDKVAEEWAAYLAKNNKFEHRDLRPVLKRCNRKFVSENLAYYGVVKGMTADAVAKKAVEMWMKSEGHRANIVSRKPTVIGLGVRKSADGERWIVVQNFAA